MRTLKWKGRGLYCFGLRTESLSLADRVESLDPSVSASELGEERGISLSRVTEERDERSDGVVGWPLSLDLPVSQESQYMSEVLSLWPCFWRSVKEKKTHRRVLTPNTYF